MGHSEREGRSQEEGGICSFGQAYDERRTFHGRDGKGHVENDGVIKGASGLLFLLVIVDITSMEHDWLYLKDRALILMGDGEFV